MRGHPRGVADRPHATPAPDAMPGRPLLGLRLAAWIVAAPFLAIGALWAAYYAVRGAAVVIVIWQAVLA